MTPLVIVVLFVIGGLLLFAFAKDKAATVGLWTYGAALLALLVGVVFKGWP